MIGITTVVLALAAFASGEITHPCGTDVLLECAATWLETAAGCVAPTITTSTTYEAAPYLMELPFFSGSSLHTEVKYEGVDDAYISEFYTDSELDRTVMTVTFPLVKSSGQNLLEYHRAGEIDIQINTPYQTTYRNVKVTAQWVGVDSITIGTARVYSEVESSTFDVYADWPVLRTDLILNPEGVPAQTYLLAQRNPEVLIREEILYVGRSIARVFWNAKLCANLP